MRGDAEREIDGDAPSNGDTVHQELQRRNQPQIVEDAGTKFVRDTPELSLDVFEMSPDGGEVFADGCRRDFDGLVE